jgi:hypothetical protein
MRRLLSFPVVDNVDEAAARAIRFSLLARPCQSMHPAIA